jgi:hypothetical protein
MATRVWEVLDASETARSVYMCVLSQLTARAVTQNAICLLLWLEMTFLWQMTFLCPGCWSAGCFFWNRFASRCSSIDGVSDQLVLGIFLMFGSMECPTSSQANTTTNVPTSDAKEGISHHKS